MDRAFESPKQQLLGAINDANARLRQPIPSAYVDFRSVRKIGSSTHNATARLLVTMANDYVQGEATVEYNRLHLGRLFDGLPIVIDVVAGERTGDVAQKLGTSLYYPLTREDVIDDALSTGREDCQLHAHPESLGFYGLCNVSLRWR